MRREQFNDAEIALVNDPSLTQAERIKIISDIKIAKSNGKYAEATVHLSFVLILTTLLNIWMSLGFSAQNTVVELFVADKISAEAYNEVMFQKFPESFLGPTFGIAIVLLVYTIIVVIKPRLNGEHFFGKRGNTPQ